MKSWVGNLIIISLPQKGKRINSDNAIYDLSKILDRPFIRILRPYTVILHNRHAKWERRNIVKRKRTNNYSHI